MDNDMFLNFVVLKSFKYRIKHNDIMFELLKKEKKSFILLNVLTPWSHVQCHCAKDIENFGTDKVRVLEIEPKRFVYI